MSENLETLRRYKEALEKSLIQEYQDLEHVMSGVILVERRKELERLYEEHRIVNASSLIIDQNGQVIAEPNIVRQRLSILNYQICDYEETIDLIISGRRAQEHLQHNSEMNAELSVVDEKIKCIEQRASG